MQSELNCRYKLSHLIFVVVDAVGGVVVAAVVWEGGGKGES